MDVRASPAARSGKPCPGASLPFDPTLTGGATNIQAGAFSPFTLTISRLPGEQNLQSVEGHLPPGLLGILPNIELCPEPEANEGKCGPNSLIGETTVGVGVGGNPYTVHGGKFFLTGPYNGRGGCTAGEPGCARFGIRSRSPRRPARSTWRTPRPTIPRATACSSGPRSKSTLHRGADDRLEPAGHPGCDPDDHRRHPAGNPARQRDHDPPDFQFNPTNCNKMEVTGTIHSSEGGPTRSACRSRSPTAPR